MTSPLAAQARRLPSASQRQSSPASSEPDPFWQALDALLPSRTPSLDDLPSLEMPLSEDVFAPSLLAQIQDPGPALPHRREADLDIPLSRPWRTLLHIVQWAKSRAAKPLPVSAKSSSLADSSPSERSNTADRTLSAEWESNAPKARSLKHAPSPEAASMSANPKKRLRDRNDEEIQALKAQVSALKKQKLTIPEIQAQTGVSAKHISRWSAEANLTRAKVSPELKQAVRQAYGKFHEGEAKRGVYEALSQRFPQLSYNQLVHLCRPVAQPQNKAFREQKKSKALAYRRAGKTPRWIVQRLNVPVEQEERWARQAGLTAPQGSRLDERDKAAIRRLRLQKKPLSIGQIAHRLQISPSSVQRIT